MSRVMCYRCFWPQSLCWCGSITPMATRTQFVFLMHPKEFKKEKAATGRLTHLCLIHSRIITGIGFDDDATVQELIHAPGNYPVLLHPGRDAVNLSGAAGAGEDRALASLRTQLGDRTLTVFLIDATWALGRKMLRLSRSLQQLPRIMFTPAAPSRYLIKQQPHPGCLSTLEATHELLGVLERSGLDRYPLPGQLLDLFRRMQEIQLRCAADPTRGGYRRRPYRTPEERIPGRGRSATRRTNVFQAPL